MSTGNPSADKVRRPPKRRHGRHEALWHGVDAQKWALLDSQIPFRPFQKRVIAKSQLVPPAQTVARLRSASRVAEKRIPVADATKEDSEAYGRYIAAMDVADHLKAWKVYQGIVLGTFGSANYIETLGLAAQKDPEALDALVEIASACADQIFRLASNDKQRAVDVLVQLGVVVADLVDDLVVLSVPAAFAKAKRAHAWPVSWPSHARRQHALRKRLDSLRLATASTLQFASDARNNPDDALGRFVLNLLDYLEAFRLRFAVYAGRSGTFKGQPSWVKAAASLPALDKSTALTHWWPVAEDALFFHFPEPTECAELVPHLTTEKEDAAGSRGRRPSTAVQWKRLQRKLSSRFVGLAPKQVHQ